MHVLHNVACRTRLVNAGDSKGPYHCAQQARSTGAQEIATAYFCLPTGWGLCPDLFNVLQNRNNNSGGYGRRVLAWSLEALETVSNPSYWKEPGNEQFIPLPPLLSGFCLPHTSNLPLEGPIPLNWNHCETICK